MSFDGKASVTCNGGDMAAGIGVKAMGLQIYRMKTPGDLLPLLTPPGERALQSA